MTLCLKNNTEQLVKAQTAICMLPLMATQAFATGQDVFTRAAELMNTIYSYIAGISTVTAGCVAAVCLYLMFFSKNQNTGTLGATLKYRDPKLHYNETWDLAKAIDYLGVDIPNAVAVLPDGLGLKYIQNNGFTVVYENNGTLVEDRMCYEFEGKDGAKIMVLASKLRIPYDCLYSTDTEDVTNIRISETDQVIPVLVYAQDKSEVTMDYELYVADFEYNGIFYRIHVEHIRAYNLDSLIREIVK